MQVFTISRSKKVFKKKLRQKEREKGNSLAVQRLRLRACTAGSEGSILVGELRSCMLHSAAKKNKNKIFFKMEGSSLMVQWLRIHLPMQGTGVQSLVQEDPTCHGATKPVRHNY